MLRIRIRILLLRRSGSGSCALNHADWNICKFYVDICCKHLKDFLRQYVCNQRRIGRFWRRNCKYYTDFLVKKVKSGSGTIVPDPDTTCPKVPDPKPQHWLEWLRKNMIQFLMLELIFEGIEEPRDLGGAPTNCANLPHPAPRHSAHAGLPKSLQKMLQPSLKN